MLFQSWTIYMKDNEEYKVISCYIKYSTQISEQDKEAHQTHHSKVKCYNLMSKTKNST